MGIFDKIGFAPVNPNRGLGNFLTLDKMKLPKPDDINRTPMTQRFMSPTQAMYQNYMGSIFNQKYAPPVMPGGVQDMGGFFGFRSPQMPAVQPRPQAPVNPYMSPQITPDVNTWWNQFGGAPGA